MALCARSEISQPKTNLDDHVLPGIVSYCKSSYQSQLQNNSDAKIHLLWKSMRDEASSDAEAEPILSEYYFTSIISHQSMESALSNSLAVKLSNASLPVENLYEIFMNVLEQNHEIIRSVCHDLMMVRERDPACISYIHCFLNFKGFLACQAYRIAHHLWCNKRKSVALLLQNRASEVFAVDIHPGARIGKGVLIDHGTGVVIGETAVIGNNVAILHNVTLGGTGKEAGDRHPKIGNDVLIGAGSCVLGNINIADGAKIGAGSVVLKPVPAKTTVVGNPARELPVKLNTIPSLTMDQTSHSQWFYVI